MGLWPTKVDEHPVGRTPSSAADPLVGLFVAPASRTRASGADQGVRPTASSTERHHFLVRGRSLSDVRNGD